MHRNDAGVPRNPDRFRTGQGPLTDDRDVDETATGRGGGADIDVERREKELGRSGKR